MMQGRAEPSLASLTSALRSLREIAGGDDQVQITTFVDASSRHRVSEDEKSDFERAIGAGDITQVPAGVQADAYILEFASNNAAIVVSNDRFRDYERDHVWLREQGSGRCFTGLEDSVRGEWIFLERNAGPRPPKKLRDRVSELLSGAAGVPGAPPHTSMGGSQTSNREPDLLAGEAERQPDIVVSDCRSGQGSYTAQITRRNPHAIVVLVDQSLSMKEPWTGGEAKSVEVAAILNKTLRELVLQATRPDGVRDYFHVAVIGYHGMPETRLKSLLPGTSVDAPLLELSAVNRLARVETTTIEDRTIRTPIWIEPYANGMTPMSSALRHAVSILRPWVETHRSAFPPVVINISDGRSTDQEDPRIAADELRSLSTTDGGVLLFNCHIGDELDGVHRYAAVRPVTDEEHVVQMFDMSSVIPDQMREHGNALGMDIPVSGRGFLFNAKPHDLVRLLNVGTQGTTIAPGTPID